jgi:GntR family transcriptional regulator
MDSWTGPIPRYWLVRAHIEELVAKQGLRPGDRLPSEPELQRELGVSRGTVRKALDDLQREGAVTRSSGRGTFVAERRMPRPLPELTSFSEHISSLGLRPGARLVSYRASRSYAEAVEHFPPGEPVARIERVRTADGVAVGVHTLYIPTGLAKRVGFSAAALRRAPGTSLYKAFEVAGVHIDVAYEAFVSRLATEHEACLLEVEPGTAVLQVTRRTFDEVGRALELVKAVYLGERYEYAIWLRRSPGPQRTRRPPRALAATNPPRGRTNPPAATERTKLPRALKIRRQLQQETGGK